ncbi:hypothetical protein [Cytobacillus purgationiresistens]|uniref:Uncharacterized protein n=1 Tax=Cytobacillus purgationiresistens TaxID=863449 RepID=A0ABU0AHZ9_9BACI|nr:hypothetical protein [Cytobacillus purgationiresistens]MDQ0270867.1 hypothetical protein [Cytobacillus purgationiresistens]
MYRMIGKAIRMIQMTEAQMEAVFEDAGYSILYEKLKYKIWMAYQWSSQDEEILDAFLSAYAFNEDEELRCNEFLFHYKIYKNIVGKNLWI